MFRKKRSIPVDYDIQGYIYFKSKMFRRLPPEGRAQIRRLCKEAGGEYADAVFEFVTQSSGAAAVSERHHIAEKTLERAVQKYYLLFAEEI